MGSEQLGVWNGGTSSKSERPNNRILQVCLSIWESTIDFLILGSDNVLFGFAGDAQYSKISCWSLAYNNDNYRKLQGGKVGIALNSDWAEPRNPSSVQDVAAAERYLNYAAQLSVI